MASPCNSLNRTSNSSRVTSITSAANTSPNRGGKRDARQSVEIQRVRLEKVKEQDGDVVFAVPISKKLTATGVNARVSPHRFVDKSVVAVCLALDERAAVEIETSA